MDEASQRGGARPHQVTQRVDPDHIEPVDQFAGEDLQEGVGDEKGHAEDAELVLADVNVPFYAAECNREVSAVYIINADGEGEQREDRPVKPGGPGHYAAPWGVAPGEEA